MWTVIGALIVWCIGQIIWHYIEMRRYRKLSEKRAKEFAEFVKWRDENDILPKEFPMTKLMK